MQDLGSAGKPGDDLDLGPFLIRLRRRWWLPVLLVVAGAGAGLLWTRLAPQRYVATTTLIPQLTTVNSQILTTLAETGGTRRRGLGWGPELLYGQILRSERIVSRVIDQELALARSGGGPTLFQVYGLQVPAETAPPGENEALAVLRTRLRGEAIRFVRDPLTEFMQLSVSLPAEPEVAARLANALVAELDRYFGELTRQRSEARLQQLSARLDKIGAELRAAAQAAPGQQERVENEEIASLRNVWILLRAQSETLQAQEYEAFKPINVLDAARAPAGPTRPPARPAGLLGGALGLLLGLVLVQVTAPRTRPAS